MSMQSKLWSINALSIELNMDRRTLAKKLEDLPPAEIKKVGNRVEKKWKLHDVIEHLSKKFKTSNIKDEKPLNILRYIHEESVKHCLYETAEDLGQVLTGLLVEKGMNKKDATSIFKDFYFFTMVITQQYLSDDKFNNLMKESQGVSFDGILNTMMDLEEKISTKPPTEDELKLQLPNVFWNCLSKKEQDGLEAVNS